MHTELCDNLFNNKKKPNDNLSVIFYRNVVCVQVCVQGQVLFKSIMQSLLSTGEISFNDLLTPKCPLLRIKTVWR